MRSISVAGEGFRFVTLRGRVFLVAVVSRILCLFLVSQWPKYFNTYHTSSQLLHTNVPPLQDRAGWRLPGQSKGGCRSWTSWERAVTWEGDRGRERRRQQPSSETGNALESEQYSQNSIEQSIRMVRSRHKGVTLLPVFLGISTSGLHTLANAPLQNTLVQAFLSSSDTQSFVPCTIPLTARRPLPFSVSLERCHENKAGNKRRSTALPLCSAASAAGAENLEIDRWLWRLVMPLLSWDGEYYMGCALQRTSYYFEMTHAFFPGLGTTYLAIKDSIWPALKRMILHAFPVWTVNSKFFSWARNLADACVLSDATWYALIAVIVSNVSFVLATVGVFEVARRLASFRVADALELATAEKCAQSKKADTYALCARDRVPLSTASSDLTKPVGRRQFSSSSGNRLQIVSSSKSRETSLEPWSAITSNQPGCSYPPKEGVKETPFESVAEVYICPESEGFWAAFWYAFSGASIHMSAAYTESFFACLTVWGLLLLTSAEENTRFFGGKEKIQLPTTENNGRIQTVCQLFRTSLFKWYGSRRSRQQTPDPSIAPRLLRPVLAVDLGRRRKAMQHTRGGGALRSIRQYFFSWMATLLFCSAALLRSNGSLSLIPLFFHTFRTCPGVRSIQTLFITRLPPSKRRVASDEFRISAAVHAPSTSAKFQSALSLVKLYVAVLLHWVNALLQALVVLLPLFLVLAYPHYLYCACPQAGPSAHSHADAQTAVWCRESSPCEFVPSLCGRLNAMRSSSAYIPPSWYESKYVQTEGVAKISSPPRSTISKQRSDYPPCPPSFTAFALSSLKGRLLYSLPHLTCSMGALLVKLPGIQYIQNMYNYASDRAKADYKHREAEFACCCKGRIPPSLHPKDRRAKATSIPPPWCASSIPNVYSYAQRQYWGVEFLGFLRLKTLYLVATTIPFYALSVLCVIHLLTRCLWPPPKSYSGSSRKCSPRIHHQRPQDVEARRRHPSTFLKMVASSWIAKVFYLLLDTETGHVVQLTILSSVMLLFAHANVSRKTKPENTACKSRDQKRVCARIRTEPLTDVARYAALLVRRARRRECSSDAQASEDGRTS